jgi:hypothetical protein
LDVRLSDQPDMMTSMKDSRLDQPHEWIGRWWRPDHPEAVSAGVLTFDPSHGIELRLIGGWSRLASTEVSTGLSAIHNEVERWPVIHGRCGTSELTLIEPWVSQSRGAWGEDPEEMTLQASTVLDGWHLDAPDSDVFVGARVSVENLTGWDQRGQAELNLGPKQPSKAEGERDVPRTVMAIIGDVEAKLQSSSGYRSTQTRRDGRSETRRTEASVIFSSDTPRAMEDWFSMVAGVSDLVSLSTMSACAYLSLDLMLPPAPELFREGHPLANHPRTVHVYQKQVVQPDSDGPVANWNDFVLSEADLPWERLFPSWMEARERFSAARSMILGLRYITRGYLDSRVVTAVGAAEAFHRALETPPPIPLEEFATLRNLLLAAAPADRKGWVNDRVQHNEPSLKQRLDELASRPGPFMTDLVPDPVLWARIAARSRNDLAHRGDGGKDYDQLYAVVEVTAAVVVLNLLREVGVPANRLQSAVSQHSEFKRAAELARIHFTSPTSA